MLGLTPLDVVEEYLALEILTQQELNDAMESIETWGNTFQLDVAQLAQDVFGPTYNFDGNGIQTQTPLASLLTASLTSQSANWIYNFGLKSIQTTTANDSIRLTSQSGISLSIASPMYATLAHHSTSGQFEQFTISANITLKLSGAHWGIDGTGNLTGAILRVGLINDGSATPAFAVYYCGGRTKVNNGNCFNTQASITAPEHVLTNRAINSGTWPIQEIGYFLADFTDSSNVWAIETAQIFPGKNADGQWQPWNTVYTGFSANPTNDTRWTQLGEMIFIKFGYQTPGTSNSTLFNFTLPVKPDTAGAEFFDIAYTLNNNTPQTTGGSGQFQNQQLTALLNRDHGGNSWTNSGIKNAAFSCSYKAFIF